MIKSHAILVRASALDDASRAHNPAQFPTRSQTHFSTHHLTTTILTTTTRAKRAKFLLSRRGAVNLLAANELRANIKMGARAEKRGLWGFAPGRGGWQRTVSQSQGRLFVDFPSRILHNGGMLDWLLESLFPLAQRSHREADCIWVEPDLADPLGLVGVGGDLEPGRLLSAYRQCIFPMYEEGEPICWWSPDPRAVFDLDNLHVSRRLARTIRSGKFEVTYNQEFVGVMRGCAERSEGTWITRDMIQAYARLNRQRHAHSVETWLNGELVGGVYGVSVGGLFAGESMFHRVSDASKVALVHLFERLRARGFVLFDTQIMNDHTRALGAQEISRENYLGRLSEAISLPVSFE
jgi:leucyl/phenylalanyl-tRNA---protein transferase